MAVTVRQVDADGRPLSSVTDHGRRGLMVGTFPARRLRYMDLAFLSDAGSHEMAVNGLATGAVEVVWNGTGVGDTGGDWTLTDDYGGSFESAAAAHSGTNGLDTGSATNEDKITLDHGSAVDLSTFSSLTLWLQPKSRGGHSDIELEWRDAGGARIGSKLKIGNYITWTIDAWTLVSIPLADFGVTSPARYLRIKFREATQQHWIDDIELTSGGGAGPVAFRVAPLAGEELTINRLLLTVVDDSTGWLHGDFAAIDGGLSAGLLLRWWDPVSGIAMYAKNLMDNLDLFGRFRVENSVAFFDAGRLVTLALDLVHPIALHETQVFEALVRDDLSTLMRLQMRAIGGVRADLEHGDAESEPPLPEGVL